MLKKPVGVDVARQALAAGGRRRGRNQAGRDGVRRVVGARVPEVLSVTRKLPNQRQKTPPLTDMPWFNSCWALTANSQLYGRLPHP